MSKLDVGVIVRQNLNSVRTRQGVVYKKIQKKQPSAIVPWTYFEVLWATGERSIERVDHLSVSAPLVDQFNDLILLRDLQESVAAGASYDQ